MKLSPSDKPPLRDIIEDLVASKPSEGSPWYGFTSESAAREHLANRSGFAAGSLASVCAYSRYPATSALNAVPDAGVDRDLLVFAGRRLRHAEPGAEYQEALQALHGFALRMNPDCAVTLEAFARLIEDYNRRVDHLPDGGIRFDPENRRSLLPPLPRGLGCLVPVAQPGEVAATIDLGTLPASRTSEPDATVASPGRAEVRVEASLFDNRTKREWREAWEKFLNGSSPREWFRQARVLCFPADEVEPEVSIYLRLGISPDRIYAVEGNPRYRESFERNCMRLGITPRFGRLEELLPTLSEPFDIVSLDFLGPYHPSYVALASKIPCADRVATLVNIEAKREGKEVQQELHKTARQRAETLARTEFLANTDDPWFARELVASDVEFSAGGPTAFPETREATADTVLSSAIGFEYRALRGERGRRVNDLLPMMYEFNHRLKEPSPYSRTYRCLSAVGEKLGTTFAVYPGQYLRLLRQVGTSDIRRASGIGDAELAMAATWFNKVFVDLPTPTRIERVRYWSESSRARSPFLSTFAVKEIPALAPETRAAVADLLYNSGKIDLLQEPERDGLDHSPQLYKLMLYHGATDRPKNPGAELRRSDYFLHVAVGMGVVGKIPISALLDIATSKRRAPKGDMWSSGSERRTVGTPTKQSN